MISILQDSNSFTLTGLPFWQRGMFWFGVVAVLIFVASFQTWAGRFGDVMGVLRILSFVAIPVVWIIFLVFSPVSLRLDGKQLSLELGYVVKFKATNFDLAQFKKVSLNKTLILNDSGQRRQLRLELDRKNSDEYEIIPIDGSFDRQELEKFVTECNQRIQEIGAN